MLLDTPEQLHGGVRKRILLENQVRKEIVQNKWNGIEYSASFLKLSRFFDVDQVVDRFKMLKIAFVRHPIERYAKKLLVSNLTRYILSSDLFHVLKIKF